MQNTLKTLSRSISRASESIDLILGSGFAPDFIVSNSDILHLADERVSRRCLLYDPALNTGFLHSHSRLLKILGDSGWQVRVVDRPPSLSCIIIDNREVHLSRFDGGSSGVPQYVRVPVEPTVVQQAEHVHAIIKHFITLWHITPNESLLYEDLLASSLPREEESIISLASNHWNNIIKALARKPDSLYKIDPHKFEELVAELLAREGLKVEVTLPSKDGGRDILALEETTTGSHLYLVECKRYASHRPITVDIVRALYGVVEEERATGGLVVTTSRFTSDAWKFREKISYRMALRDYETLKKWLNRHANSV